MRFIFISGPTFPSPDSGGGSAVVYRHLARLQQDGNEILIVSFSNPSQVSGNTHFDTINLSKSWWYPPIRKGSPWLTDIRFNFHTNVLAKKISFVKENDILIGVLGELQNLVIASLAKRFQLRSFLFYHDDSLFNFYGKLNVLSAKHIRRIIERSTLIMAVSKPMVQLLLSKGIEKVGLLYPVSEFGIHPIIRDNPIDDSALKFLTSGMVMPVHFNLLKTLGKIIVGMSGQFFCLTDLSQTNQHELAADNSVTVTPRFSTLKELFNFVTTSVDVLVVYYSFDENDELRIFTSFPSKLLEYCNLGLPVLIVAPPESSLGKWATENNWLSFVSSDNPIDIAISVEKFKDQAYWRKCQLQSIEMAHAEFNPERIHSQFVEYLTTGGDGLNV